MMFAGALRDRPARLGSFRDLSFGRAQRAGGLDWRGGMVKSDRGETTVRRGVQGSGSTNAPLGLRVADAWSKEFAIAY